MADPRFDFNISGVSTSAWADWPFVEETFLTVIDKPAGNIVPGTITMEIRRPIPKTEWADPEVPEYTDSSGTVLIFVEGEPVIAALPRDAQFRVLSSDASNECYVQGGVQ